MSTETVETLFDARFLQKLERLELLARKIFRGLIHGEQLSRRRGTGLEFSDYRTYQPGDDLRYIDWSIYARLDRLFLKLYASDEDVTLHLLLDSSASMGFGTPLKFDYARRLTAALGYIGLGSLDRVALQTFAGGQGVRQPVLKSKASVVTMLKILDAMESARSTGFAQAMKQFATRTRNPGVVLLITDLLADEEELFSGLVSLQRGRHDVILLHLLAEDEINPPLEGPFNLVDSEDGSSVRITIDAGLRQLYLKRLNSHLESVQNFCRIQGVEYLRASTAIPFEDLVLRYLRQGNHWR